MSMKQSNPIKGLQSAKPALHEQVSKFASGFMTADQGPFECQRCDFWHTNETCELVEGSIKAMDCCNLFTSKGK